MKQRTWRRLTMRSRWNRFRESWWEYGTIWTEQVRRHVSMHACPTFTLRPTGEHPQDWTIIRAKFKA